MQLTYAYPDSKTARCDCDETFSHRLDQLQTCRSLIEGLFWSAVFTVWMVIVAFFTPWGMTIILVPLPVLIVCVWPIARAAFEGKTRKLNDLADSERD
jgi:hypothetical protein